MNTDERYAAIVAALYSWVGNDDPPGSLTWKEWADAGYTKEEMKVLCPIIEPERLKDVQGDTVEDLREAVFQRCHDIWLAAIRASATSATKGDRR